LPALITGSGLLFIGATIYDHKLRAFDRSNGKLLWEHELPYAGTATPATYSIDGRQYVVIATSNARNPKAPQGNAYVAFALPDNPLQLRAHHATAAVKDIDRAVRWYRDVLGFTLAERGARNGGAMQYAEMKISGYGVGLVQLSGGAEDDGADGAHAGARGWIHLVFAVPDAARTYHLLVERGAKPYLHPGQESAPVKAFLVRDSEGNEIEIVDEQR
jgi:catechol 2,3-dioxygenase-like lactoylglutathione lyase family enzyme